MPARSTVSSNRTIGRQKALGVSRFKPLHVPLLLAGGSVRVLHAIFEVLVLSVFSSG